MDSLPIRAPPSLPASPDPQLIPSPEPRPPPEFDPGPPSLRGSPSSRGWGWGSSESVSESRAPTRSTVRSVWEERPREKIAVMIGRDGLRNVHGGVESWLWFGIALLPSARAPSFLSRGKMSSFHSAPPWHVTPERLRT
eukprot:3077734-Rhodomonas_salina.1